MLTPLFRVAASRVWGRAFSAPSVSAIAHEARLAAQTLAAAPPEKRDLALRALGDELASKQNEILAANAEDLKACAADGAAPQLVARVGLENKFASLQVGLKQLEQLDDPLARVTLGTQLQDGLTLYRVACPIGVLGIIYEARPEAGVQIFSLAVKSGNVVILKGGKEAKRSNRALFECMQNALRKADLPETCVQLVESREAVSELLQCTKDVDLIIPRGSNELVASIQKATSIPVLGHADGICHVYVDEFADLKMAVQIVKDAKTNYPAACNTMETLLVHQGVAADFLPQLQQAMPDVKFHASDKCRALLPGSEPAGPTEFSTEWLDLECSVDVVSGWREAVDHVNKYSSQHTDAIVTSDNQIAEKFMQWVDSANVYHNCSTRWADGFRYGFGAEVGISTNRIHARGPVGLEGLVIYKYRLYGNGHTVGQHAALLDHAPLQEVTTLDEVVRKHTG